MAGTPPPYHSPAHPAYPSAAPPPRLGDVHCSTVRGDIPSGDQQSSELTCCIPQRHFEERVFACVVDDEHLYVRRPLSESLFQIACRAFDDRDIHCPAHYTVTKQKRAEGRDWICTDVHTQHAEACIDKARRVQAELQGSTPNPAPHAENTVQSDTQSQLSQPRLYTLEDYLTYPVAPQLSSAAQGHARTDLPVSLQSADHTKHTFSEAVPTDDDMVEPIVKHESPPPSVWQDASNTFATDVERDEQPGLASGSGRGSPALSHDNQEILQDRQAVPQNHQKVCQPRGELQQPASIEAIKVRAVWPYY